MARAFSAFEIKFSGLNKGSHDYEFEVDKSFFDAFEVNYIDAANITVHINLVKQTNMLITDFGISGGITTICDRCADPLDLQIKTEQRLIYKIGDADFEDNEEVVVLTEADDRINVAEPIYQFVLLAFPLKKTHEEGQCNQEMIDKLNELKHKPKDDDGIDPRWNKLKDLN